MTVLQRIRQIDTLKVIRRSFTLLVDVGSQAHLHNVSPGWLVPVSHWLPVLAIVRNYYDVLFHPFVPPPPAPPLGNLDACSVCFGLVGWLLMLLFLLLFLSVFF